MIDFLIVIGKLLLTFIAAGLFGLQRQRAHKPIGFGTFIFVSIGSCSLAIAAIRLVPENPLPLLSAIVSGIGFLGAGAMIRTTDKIFGVTTAAGIWLFAIFGLLVGVGEFVLAVLAYGAVWLVILIDDELQRRGIGSYQRKVILTTNKIMNEKEIRQVLYTVTGSFKLLEMSVDKQGNKMTLTYVVEGPKDTLNHLPTALYDQKWFGSCSIS